MTPEEKIELALRLVEGLPPIGTGYPEMRSEAFTRAARLIYEATHSPTRVTS